MASETTTPEVVGGNVYALLARGRRSQQELADHLGKSQAYVNRRLRGHVSFDISDLDRIAEFFAVPVSELVTAPQVASTA